MVAKRSNVIVLVLLSMVFAGCSSQLEFFNSAVAEEHPPLAEYPQHNLRSSGDTGVLGTQYITRATPQLGIVSP